MRKLHELTALQQQFSEEHIGIVYKYLHTKHLPIDEFYDIVIFGYLSAVQEYDERPELNCFHFTTIAWSRMQECLYQHYAYQHRPIRYAPQISLYALTEMGTSLDELLPNRKQDVHEHASNWLLIMEIMSQLTDTERQLVTLKAKGLSIREIAEQFSLSTSGIQSRFTRMRKRLADALEEIA